MTTVAEDSSPTTSSSPRRSKHNTEEWHTPDRPKIVMVRTWENGRRITTRWKCDGKPFCYSRNYRQQQDTIR